MKLLKLLPQTIGILIGFAIIAYRYATARFITLALIVLLIAVLASCAATKNSLYIQRSVITAIDTLPNGTIKKIHRQSVPGLRPLTTADVKIGQSLDKLITKK